MCVNACIPGGLGCECNAGQCLAGLECVGDICSDPNCMPGELSCECNDGQCLGDLECVGNVCLEGSGTSDASTGDGDTTETDTTSDGCGAGEMLCNGSCTDVMTDDLNCGQCGNICETVGQSGGCDNGICAPALSECVTAEDPPQNCSDVCSGLGKSCVAQGCNGVSYVWYGTFDECEQFIGSPNPSDCTYPMASGGVYYRCCCEQQ